MDSDILDYDVEYSVYLPEDYETSQRAYPVVYLLHGYTDDETGWTQFGEVKRLVDEGIASGEIPPMIIIMPDGKVTWYMNDHAGTELWEDMFIKEFMPHVEGKYRIKAKKEFRGISGLSMGGFGSLRLSLTHTDLFAACAGYSSALWTANDFADMGQEGYDNMFGKLIGQGLSGKKRITDHWKTNSIIDLVRSKPLEELNKVRFYFDCGDDDFLAIANAQLHIEMRRKNLPHEYRVRDGAHTWGFWRTSLPIGLKFIGESFRR
ncbi:MAG: esterase family protein [Roseivirga sp.]|nr:esterase family protein [Roseivirga sp.]